jgi:biotin operon repressor
LIDEDVWTGLAEALRQAGYDVVSVNEVGRKGLSDEE